MSNIPKNTFQEDLPLYLKERIEQNRQKALTLKNSKLLPHPNNNNNNRSHSNGDIAKIDNSTITIGIKKYKDTGGGFLLEETTDNDGLEKPFVPKETPIIELDPLECENCNKTFISSMLLEKFECKCCDVCKELDTYKLITKTDAKTKYLLQDCDLDKRPPVLKFIQRKNPHNVRWGDMKLYLEKHVKNRALEIWESVENIEEERTKREEKRVIAKSRKYVKHINELRMNVRSSLYDKTSAPAHSHEFGSEIYNQKDDTYTRKCKTCPYEETFEKM